MRPFIVLNFCSGIGGSSLAIKQSGGLEIFSCEINKAALVILTLNFPELFVWDDDMRKWSMELMNKLLQEQGYPPIMPGDADLTAYTTPCQNVSLANSKRWIFHPDNRLFISGLNITDSLKSKTTIFENVKNLNSASMRPLKALILTRISKMKDYVFDERLLNSLDYNVPSRRERVILQLTRVDIGKPVWPKPTTTDYEALNLNRQYPEIIGINPNVKNFQYKSANRPSNTLTKTASELIYTDDIDIPQKFKPRQRGHLMGFPYDFKMGPNPLIAGKLFGNAVCPPFFRALVEAIRDNLIYPYLDNMSDEERQRHDAIVAAFLKREKEILSKIKNGGTADQDSPQNS